MEYHDIPVTNRTGYRHRGARSMTEVVNLNKARKERDRAAEKAQADANAVKFGRTKAQRLLEASLEEKTRQRLAQQKFEDE